MPLYFRNVGIAWNDNTSWSTTSSTGASAGVIPAWNYAGNTGDDVIFDANSALSCPITGGSGSCGNITTTNYTGTITLTSNLNVYGNHIIGPNTIILGSGWYTVAGRITATTRTITSNSVLFPKFQLNIAGPPAQTLTLNDALNVTDIVHALANTMTTNGNFVNVNGSMTMENASIAWSGTTVYNLVGSGNGNFGMSNTNAVFGNTININKSGGTITFLANVRLSGATFTYNSGTVNTTTNSSLFDLYANNTVTSKNVGAGTEIVFNNVRGGVAGINGTTTLNSDMRVAGNFTVGAFNGYSFNNNTIFVNGNVINPNTNITNGGTSIMEMIGSNPAFITNTAATPSSSTGYLQRTIIINKSGGASVTLTGGLTWGGVTRNFTLNGGNTLTLNGNLTVTQGTLTVPATATLTPNLNTLSFTTSGSKTLNTPNVTWYNVTNNTQTALVILSSVLNISNNLSFINTLGSAACGFTGNFLVNVSGSLLLNDTATTTGIQFTGGGSINMIGTGTIRGATLIAFPLNINTTNPTGYVIGDATFPTTVVGNLGVINLQGTSIASVYSPTGHTLDLRVGSTLNTNNVTTQILWGNLTTTPNGTQTTTISQPSIFQGNLSYANVSAIFVLNGAKVTVYGNLSGPSIQGTSEIELGGSGSGTWSAGSYQNNITINKSGAGSITLSGAITWGLAGRILQKTAGNINGGTSTVTIPVSISVTISNMTFGNLTIGAGATIIQNQLNTINLSLLLSGNTTFAGTHGFTTNGFNCTTASAVITLQNADATYGSPLAAYNVTGPLILQGGSTTTRITLQASGRAEFTGAIALASPPTFSAMTTTAPTLGTIRIGMTVSGRSVIPAGLQPFITDRPVISSGSGLNWFINKTLIANPVPAGTPLSAGFKAIFNLTNTGTNVNVGLVTTQDIDSSGGKTILAALSNGDDTATNTALYRTLNWGPLIAPSGSVYYTWVD